MAESAVVIPSVSRDDEALAVVVEGIISAAELLQEDDIDTIEAKAAPDPEPGAESGARHRGLPLPKQAPWGPPPDEVLGQMITVGDD